MSKAISKEKKRLFYFATEKEAAGARQLLHAEKLVAEGLYICSQGYVLVGGMGILAAACSVAGVRGEWDELWNFGIAATLSAHYPVETRVIVSSVQRPNWLPGGLETRSREWYERLFPVIQLREEGARLVSSDYPVHQPHLAEELRTLADLLDMEGYGLAFAARQLSRPCFIGKWVTDAATQEGPLAIQKLLKDASDHFAGWIDELLRDPPAFSMR